MHRRHGFGPWRQKFSAEISDGTLAGERVLLVKPQTYMNESGRSVGEIVRFHKLAPADTVVIHDELDLPPGKFRLKVGGGHGGHNGLRSLSDHLGDGYRRLRLGIGHPGDRALVHNYVLHDFAKADAKWLDPLLEAIAAEAPLLAEGKDALFGNRVHLALAPPKPPRPAAGRPPETASGKAAGTSAASQAAGQPGTPSPEQPAAAPAPTGPFAGLVRFVRGKG